MALFIFTILRRRVVRLVNFLYLYNYNYHLRYLALVLDRAIPSPSSEEGSSIYSLSSEPISFVIDKQLQIIIIVRTPLYLIIKIDPTIVPSLNSFLWISPSSRNFKSVAARSTKHQPYHNYKLTLTKYYFKTLFINYKFTCYFAKNRSNLNKGKF